MKAIRDLFLGSVIGFALGGVLGLLLAPNSGEENRKVIYQQYSETTDKVRQAMLERREELESEIESFADRPLFPEN
jgi:gas vesicle protein